jgi:hypothetical protein
MILADHIEVTRHARPRRRPRHRLPHRRGRAVTNRPSRIAAGLDRRRAVPDPGTEAPPPILPLGLRDRARP